MKIRTRFAPSPTGTLHIGGARTAIFNWLFAKKYKGAFYLRIEDTDKERSKIEYIESIKTGLKWLGLDWDEEIVFQSANIKRHVDVVKNLINEGKAYYCYTTQDEIQEFKKKNPGKKFISKWRNAQPHKEELNSVIRLKTQDEGVTILEDDVLGRIEVNNSEMDDMVLLRSDGTPTYIISCVIDDYDMQITNVIRGNDHLTNTFRQLQIIKALNWNPPNYAHIPLIHSSDGSKMSKREGALGIDEYQNLGYLPQAIFNYLLRLGWSYADEEIIESRKAIEVFDLKDINKSPARFDLDKLNFINQYYIRLLDNEIILSCSESTNAKNQICRWLEKLLTVKSINEQSSNFTEKYKKILQNIYKYPIEKKVDIAYAKVGIDQRPKKISITGIEKLISNPYVYYAKYILKTNPLEKIAREAEKKELGILLHDLIPKALSEQHANSEEFSNWFLAKFNEYIQYKHIPYKISKFWCLRVENTASSIYKNFYHQDENYKSFNEIVGIFNLQLQSHNIELFCIADRIEISQRENTAEIIDFKSGHVPNESEVATGLYPQLPIEKYIFENRGFKLDINDITIVNLQYFDISGKSKGVEKKVIKEDLSEIEKGLKLLLEKFLCNETDFFITRDKVINKRNKNYFHILRI